MFDTLLQMPYQQTLTTTNSSSSSSSHYGWWPLVPVTHILVAMVTCAQGPSALFRGFALPPAPSPLPPLHPLLSELIHTPPSSPAPVNSAVVYMMWCWCACIPDFIYRGKRCPNFFLSVSQKTGMYLYGAAPPRKRIPYASSWWRWFLRNLTYMCSRCWWLMRIFHHGLENVKG